MIGALWQGHPTGLPSAAQLPRYRKLVMAVTVLGTYLIAINATVLGLALPAITHDLAIEPALADWVVTTYLLAIAVALPLTGWLADRFGKRRTFLVSLSVFGMGAAISMGAQGLATMLVGRAAQGIGGGAILPLSMTMVYELYPPNRRGTAIGLWGIAVAAAPALGPPMGGWLLTSASWRWIFAVLLFFASASLVLALPRLRDVTLPAPTPLDRAGSVLAAVAMSGVVLVSRYAGAWRFADLRTLGVLALAGGAIALLVRRSGQIRHPILNLGMFASPAFCAAMALLVVVTIAQFTVLTFLPIELQVIRGMSALEVGLLLAPFGIAVSLAMPAGGALADRRGPRVPVGIGLAMTIVGTALLANRTPDGSVWLLIGALVAHGVGGGLVYSPLQVIAMTSVYPRLVTQASVMTQLNRQVSAAVGTAAMAAVLVAQLGSVTPEVTTAAGRQEAQSGYNLVFLITVVLLGLGAGFLQTMPAQQLKAMEVHGSQGPS